MRRVAILISLAAAVFAQDTAELFNRAPKSVDDALRARINEFYEAHVKSEFRKAEALVAEDTKDYFYDHDKPQYLGFEINRIEYTDGYTKAKATISVQQRVMFPGFNGEVMKIPTASYWKLEDGKWYWYIDKDKLNETPWGRMKAGPAPAGGAPAAVIPMLPGDVDQLMNLVRADQTGVILKPGESAQVVIDNGMQGPVTLTMEGKLEGIDAVLDRASVPGGEKATLSLKAGDGAKGGVIAVRAAPLGKVISIQVTVK